MQIFHNKLVRGREEWEGGERVKIWQWLSSAFAFAVDFGRHEYRKRVQEEGEREKQKERERGRGGERERTREKEGRESWQTARWQNKGQKCKRTMLIALARLALCEHWVHFLCFHILFYSFLSPSPSLFLCLSFTCI